MPTALFVATNGNGMPRPADFDLTYDTGETVSVYRDRFVWLSDPLPEPLPEIPEGETLEEIRRVRTGGTDEEPVFENRVRLRKLEDEAQRAGGMAILYHIPDTNVWFFWVHSSAAKLLALHTHLVGIHEALGALAVIDPDQQHAFRPAAVRNAFGWTAQQAAQRRDRMAAWLANNGYPNDVSSATNEHELVEKIVEALGFAMKQLWKRRL